MVVIVGPYNLLKVEDRVAQIVQLLESFGLVEVGLGERSGRLIAALSDVCKLVEVLQGLLRHLHLEEEETALHQTLAHCLSIDLDRLAERQQRLVVVANSFETIPLA